VTTAHETSRRGDGRGRLRRARHHGRQRSRRPSRGRASARSRRGALSRRQRRKRRPALCARPWRGRRNGDRSCPRRRPRARCSHTAGASHHTRTDAGGRPGRVRRRGASRSGSWRLAADAPPRVACASARVRRRRRSDLGRRRRRRSRHRGLGGHRSRRGWWSGDGLCGRGFGARRGWLRSRRLRRWRRRLHGLCRHGRLRWRAGCGRRRCRGRRRPGARRRPGRSGDPARRQEAHRVEVSVRVGGDAHSQVDVRHRPLGLAARADHADGGALVDLRALDHSDSTEMGERDRQPVAREDADGLAVAWHGAGERHGARGGRVDGLGVGSGDVDAAMLPTRVGVVTEEERTEHGSLRRPRPRGRPRGRCQHGRDRPQENDRPHRPGHDSSPPLLEMTTETPA